MTRCLAISLWITLLLPWCDTTAQDPSRIEVFTISSVPIAGATGAEVHWVDALAILTQRLGQNLPKHPEQAQAIVLSRLQITDPTFIDQLRRAALALTRAKQLGIDRVPAVVLDGKWVVYGVTDVRVAREYFQRATTRTSPVKRP